MMNKNVPKLGLGKAFGRPSVSVQPRYAPLSTPAQQQQQQPSSITTTNFTSQQPRGPTIRHAKDVFGDDDDDDDEENLAVVQPPTIAVAPPQSLPQTPSSAMSNNTTTTTNTITPTATNIANKNVFDDEDGDDDDDGFPPAGVSNNKKPILSIAHSATNNTPSSTTPVTTPNLAALAKKNNPKKLIKLSITSNTNNPTPTPAEIAEGNQLVKLSPVNNNNNNNNTTTNNNNSSLISTNNNNNSSQLTNTTTNNNDTSFTESGVNLEPIYEEVTEDERIAMLKEQKRLKKELYKQIQLEKEAKQKERQQNAQPQMKTIEERLGFPPDWPKDAFTFFIGNLGQDVNAQVLIDYFKARYPSCLTARVVYEKDGVTSKTFGYVCFRNALEMAKAFKQEDRQFIGSRRVFIKKADLQDAKTNGYDGGRYKK